MKEPYITSNGTILAKRKKRLAYNLEVRKAFEIRRHNCAPGNGLNEDNGTYLKTDIWDPTLRGVD